MSPVEIKAVLLEQRILLDKGENERHPAMQNTPGNRELGQRLRDGAGRKDLMRVVVVVQPQTDLLEIVVALRTFCTAGTSRAIRMAMMAITTKSSINVKPTRCRE